MKIYASVIAVLVLIPALARAEVLLERTELSGHTLEEYSFAITCSIEDTGQLTVQYSAGHDLRSHRVQQLQITLPALRAAISEAYKGDLAAIEPFPVDGPTYRYRAFKRLADDRQAEVILWEEDGGSGRKRINGAPAAIRLKNFIDLNCGGQIRY